MSEKLSNNIVGYGKESTPAPKEDFKCTTCNDTGYCGEQTVEYTRNDGTKETRSEPRPCSSC